MKRKLLPILLSAIMLLGSLGLVACGKQYTIVFNTNGGSAVESIVAEDGVDIKAPTDPTKAGYIFDGWFLDANLTESYEIPSKMPADSFNLYARWKLAKIVVSFDSNGGSSVADITQDATTEIEEPEAPTKAGYHFAGWYTDSALITPFDFKMPIYNTTVYARWLRLEEKTAISLNKDWVQGDANGYIMTAKDGATTIEATKDKSEYSYIKIEIGMNVKDYSTFALDLTGTKGQEMLIKCEKGGVTAVETRIMLNGKDNQKFFWKVLPENLTDGQAPMNFLVFLRPGQKGEGATVSINKFDLYRTRADGDSLQSAIFFNTLGGSSVSTMFADTGSDISSPTTEPVKAGYTFMGWYTNANCTTPFVFGKMPDGKTTVYAGWESKVQVTITFNSNGGSTVNDITKPAGSKMEASDKPINPTKENVIFDAWYLDSAFSKPFDWKTMPEENSTLYARWVVLDQSTAINVANDFTTTQKYTITKTTEGYSNIKVDAGKDTYSMFGTKLNINAKKYSVFQISIVGTADKKVLLKCQNGGVTAVETKVDMTGAEQTIVWTVDGSKNLPDGSMPMDLYMCLDPGVKHAEAPTTEISITVKSIKLLRLVEPNDIAQNVIHFTTNGGYSISPMFAKSDSALTLPTARKRGFVFGGWFSDESLAKPFTATVMPAQNTTVYAKWNIDTESTTEYALKKDGWNTVSGYKNYTTEVADNGAKLSFNHTDNAWNANAAAAYTVSDMGADGSRYSKLKINAKLQASSLEGQKVTVRVRFYGIDQNFAYNGATTATFTFVFEFEDLGADKDFILDFATITDSNQRVFFDNLLSSGKFAMAFNIYAGASSANHGIGSILINSAVFA